MKSHRRVAGSRMPSTKEMAERARAAVAINHSGTDIFNPAYIKINFDSLIAELLEAEYRIFQEVQRDVYVPRLATLLSECLPDGENITDNTIRVAAACLFDPLDTFYLGLSNARKTRAGTSFEDHTRYLFRHLGYPFDEQVVINGKPDFLLPSADEYRRNPQNSILFTVKRTLRERWRQIVPEGVRSPTYFLATVDDKVSSNALQEMRQNRVVLVVPRTIQSANPVFASAPNVVDFQRFFEDYLDPAMVRWRRAGLAADSRSL